MQEFLATLSGGAATAVAAALTDTSQIAAAATSPDPAFRTGAARNPAASDDTLDVLTRDKNAEVSSTAQETVNARAEAESACTAAEPNASRLFQLVYREGIERLLDSNPDLAVAGLLQAGAGKAAARLHAVDKPLHDAIMVTWLAGQAPIDAYAVNWALSTDLRRETFLDGVPIQVLSRRSSGSAMVELRAAGYLPRSQSSGSFASIEMMAQALPLAEVAGLLVASDTPVDSNLADQILLAAAPSTVTNYLLGACTRRPAEGDVVRLLAAATSDQRSAWASALTSDTSRTESIGSLPWAGELLLLGSMDWLAALDDNAVASLNAVLAKHLGDIPAAWDMTLVMSEEWESTLFDLLSASVAMESETA